MTDILLKDIDPALIARLQTVAAANGWQSDESLRNVLEGITLADVGAGALRPDLAQLLDAPDAWKRRIP